MRSDEFDAFNADDYSFTHANRDLQDMRRARRNGPPTTARGEAALQMGQAAWYRRRAATGHAGDWWVRREANEARRALRLARIATNFGRIDLALDLAGAAL